MRKKPIVSLVLIAVFFSWVYYKERTHHPNCEEYTMYKNASLKGIVIDKYLDYAAHSYPKILIQNFDTNDSVTLNMTLDTTHLFDVVSIADTIYKAKGDSVISVKNGNKLIKRKIDFGCIFK